MRRLRLRWNRSDLEGITEFKQLMDVVHKYEVLAHMKLGEDGIEHLAEIIPEEGGNAFTSKYKDEYARDVTIHQLRQPLKGFTKNIIRGANYFISTST